MKVIAVEEIFEVRYGINLELVHLEQCDNEDADAIFFVSRTEKNNGVSAIVRKIEGIEPNPAHTLSVAGGGSIMSSFYQKLPYYSGRDLYILIPKIEISPIEMLFYAYCLRMNKYKYNYGRQANKTIKDLLIPEKIPDNFKEIKSKIFAIINETKQFEL